MNDVVLQARLSNLLKYNGASNDDFNGIWQIAFFFEIKGYFVRKNYQ